MSITKTTLMASLICIACTVGTAHPDSDHTKPEIRTISIPGTVVEFDLVPVSMQPDRLFWVATTEVTWDLYDVYLYALDVPDGAESADAVTRPSKPYVPPDRGMGHAGYPAIGMTRQAAESFCVWLTTITGLAVRLPTPAEFTAYASSSAAEDPQNIWSSATSDRTTHPVATKPANNNGLHDTLGNVAEWVATEGKPVAMGGSYLDPPEACLPESVQRQVRSWNQSDPQIPKSQWWLADCSWVGFRIVIEEMPNEEPE